MLVGGLAGGRTDVEVRDCHGDRQNHLHVPESFYIGDPIELNIYHCAGDELPQSGFASIQ